MNRPDPVPTADGPPRRKRRLSAIAVVAGVVLLGFEVRNLIVNGAGDFEKWFWLTVAVLLIVLGTVDLLSPARAKTSDDPGPLDLDGR